MPENIIGNANQPISAKVPVIARQKKFRWLMAVRRRTLLASCFCECHFILQLGCFASCLGHLKGKCMTKLMKVCIGNHQRIDSRKCTSTETLDKNLKTLILVFRCWHYKAKWRKPFEVQPPRRRPLRFVCHAFIRNECVTNEPQRTSAGRLVYGVKSAFTTASLSQKELLKSGSL